MAPSPRDTAYVGQGKKIHAVSSLTTHPGHFSLSHCLWLCMQQTEPIRTQGLVPNLLKSLGVFALTSMDFVFGYLCTYISKGTIAWLEPD